MGVTKNIICFKSIFESERVNHSVINKNPIAITRIKMRRAFCKYSIPNIQATKIRAAGNL
jgi:hypothetical protein